MTNNYIIINADDYGKTQSINGAICDCFNKGYISSTTIMVNMPFTDEAVELSKTNGFIDKVGLHFNITYGKPLSRRFNSPLLVNKEGCFNGVFHKSK